MLYRGYIDLFLLMLFEFYLHPSETWVMLNVANSKGLNQDPPTAVVELRFVGLSYVGRPLEYKALMFRIQHSNLKLPLNSPEMS